MDKIRPFGEVEIQIFDKESLKTINIKNRILNSGRIALTKAIGNSFGGAYEFFVTGMAFGSGGTSGGSPRYIDETRDGLFGPTVITKPVIATINPDTYTSVVFTSVLAYDDAVGYTINEMALSMYSGDFFSMTTFGDLTKTSSQQYTVNWSVSMV